MMTPQTEGDGQSPVQQALPLAEHLGAEFRVTSFVVVEILSCFEQSLQKAKLPLLYSSQQMEIASPRKALGLSLKTLNLSSLFC